MKLKDSIAQKKPHISTDLQFMSNWKKWYECWSANVDANSYLAMDSIRHIKDLDEHWQPFDERRLAERLTESAIRHKVMHLHESTSVLAARKAAEHLNYNPDCKQFTLILQSDLSPGMNPEPGGSDVPPGHNVVLVLACYRIGKLWFYCSSSGWWKLWTNNKISIQSPGYIRQFWDIR